MREKTYFKPNEVEGKTRLKLEQVINIAKVLIPQMSEKYELIPERILYTTTFHITNEPVWYVDMITTLNKQLWPDAYESLVISDFNGRAICIINDHGSPCEIKLL